MIVDRYELHNHNGKFNHYQTLSFKISSICYIQNDLIYGIVIFKMKMSHNTSKTFKQQ